MTERLVAVRGVWRRARSGWNVCAAMTKRIDLDEVGKAATAYVEGELVYDSEHNEYFIYSKRRDAFRALHGAKWLRGGTAAEYEQLSRGELNVREPLRHQHMP